ncbi:aminotransferase class I/II-fold pyridoxal phosphate-dependent enzyme [Polaromonas sp. SM01]|uniref:aminotransferase class I/II-fold pyridoxal phosphate-dependent enzyme n=1 Tax=Polaromonas sp. SM01 TaxID=3085630 RepID=UPI00298129FE|nr:aminotransferase class I/II-fold pyridoxal phosphate-dependent enzyme [Polaromonas sp. SM01]MDW5444800.1 aminotransferase class I/II-fold pyridoxal phosphate-dependent enzyme [Polaromonas sp. SM01]
MVTDSTFSTRSHGGQDSLGVPLHDFSTNSHACGPCPPALAAVQQADASVYPDAAYSALRAQLAAFHGVAVQRVLLAGSASEFIFRITALAAQRGAAAVWLPPHSYGDYAQSAQAWGLTAVPQPAQAQLRWACDPSSPLGAAHAGLAEQVDTAALCVLDRAYEPLRLSGRLALSDESLQQCWQLWTPNKALGLTGVRAAYVIAPLGADEAVIQLERLAPSWPVGAHGVAMLQAWTTPAVQTWLADSLGSLRDWKTRQIALCESLGWTCLPSEANFFCARPALSPAMNLQQVLSELRAQGIKLRDTTSFGLPGHVRISVLAPAAQDTLHNTWQHIIKKAA